MKNGRLQIVLIAMLLLAVSSAAYGERYAALFDTWWLPLVHDWTQQLHEPKGAEFRRVEVPEGRNMYWEKGGASFEWSELQLRRAGEHGFLIATYQRVDDSGQTDAIAGEWDFRGRPLTIVEVPRASSLDVFILHEDVPVVDGAYLNKLDESRIEGR